MSYWILINENSSTPHYGWSEIGHYYIHIHITRPLHPSVSSQRHNQAVFDTHLPNMKDQHSVLKDQFCILDNTRQPYSFVDFFQKLLHVRLWLCPELLICELLAGGRHVPAPTYTDEQMLWFVDQNNERQLYL